MYKNSTIFTCINLILNIEQYKSILKINFNKHRWKMYDSIHKFLLLMPAFCICFNCLGDNTDHFDFFLKTNMHN